MATLSIPSQGQDVCTNYYNQIPNNTGQAVIQASAVSFVISTIIAGNPVTGLANAALSAIVTTIYALVSPIFKRVIGADRQLTCGEAMLRGAIAHSAGCLVLLAVGSPVAIESLAFYAILHTIFHGIFYGISNSLGHGGGLAGDLNDAVPLGLLWIH